MSSADRMEELVRGLRGPPGPPGRGRAGRPGPDGEPGPQGTTVLCSTASIQHSVPWLVKWLLLVVTGQYLGLLIHPNYATRNQMNEVSSVSYKESADFCMA